MRISALKDDPGYMVRRPPVRVFFNGTEINCVFTADEEKRMVVRAAHGKDGKLMFNGAGIATETLYGDVRIELRHDEDKAADAGYRWAMQGIK